MVDYAKAAAFSDYIRLRKLRVHTARLNREVSLTGIDRGISNHEKHYPDFPKAYDKWRETHDRT